MTENPLSLGENSTLTQQPFVDNEFQELRQNAVRSLIRLQLTGMEADKIIQDFYPELRGEDTQELLEKKIELLKILFPSITKPISPKGETLFQETTGDYYATIDLLAKGLIGRDDQANSQTTQAIEETQPIKVEYTIK